MGRSAHHVAGKPTSKEKETAPRIERAAEQWSERIRRWAEKHYGHIPKKRRRKPSDDPRF
jgi:hypothetical protein